MAYKTIHTLYGLSRLSAAEASRTKINLPHMAVGDGNGNPVEPSEGQTTLVRERYRATVNRVYQDPNNPQKFSAELVIPASVGGFVLREVGVFDDAGSLSVVGNLPETYKPVDSEGAFSDTVVRVDFMVANPDSVTIIADPNVVVVTQAWVMNNVTAGAIIPGGTTGQLLAKQSNADGDTHWVDPDAINVTVDTIAEKQLLAAGQTIVDLTVTTTYGLAVYIDGLRLDMGSGAGEWQPHETIETRVILGQSYPAGTRITLVNNEPAGSAPAPLERSKNLSDVQDQAAARGYLDVYSKAEVNQRVRQPGDIFYTAADTAPPFSLKANGAAVSRTAYAALFARIGTRYGAGDGFTTFNLPDGRGVAPRGWDDGRGIDGGRVLGSLQAGSIQSHTHTGTSADAGNHTHTGSAQPSGDHNHSASSGFAGWHQHTGTTSTSGEHTHSVKEGSTAPTADGTLSSGDDYTKTTAFTQATGSAGSHDHTFTTSPADDHNHSISVGNGGAHTHNLSINSGGTHKHGITIDAAGSAETRMINIAFLCCIAF